MTRHLIAVLACLVIAPLARAELVDNPMYTAWAKAKPGTAITLAVSPDPAGPARPDEDGVMRLLAVTPESVTVELGSSKPESSKQKLTLPAKIESGEEAIFIIPPEQRGHFAVRNPAKADDKITIDGKPVDAICYSATIDMTPPREGIPAMSIALKVWIAPSLPGGLAKMEISEPGRNGQPGETRTITAVAWQKADQPAATAPATQPATRP